MNNKNISVLIVDDNAGFVKRMRGMLGELDNVTNIDAAKDYDEAIQVYDRNKQDMILLDINLPGKSGINFLQDIRQKGSDSKVIMLSNHSDDYYRERCKELGALHFLDKTAEFDLVPSIVAGTL